MATVTRTPGEVRANFEKAMEALSKRQAAVGWFDTSKYPDGTPAAYVASIQEFGYPKGKIPARPFVSVTLAAQKAHWAVLIQKGAMGVLKGKITADAMLEQFGQLAAGEIRKTLSSIVSPEISKRTKQGRATRRKVKLSAITGAAAKPLNDTGYMLATLTNQTIDKGSIKP